MSVAAEHTVSTHISKVLQVSDSSTDTYFAKHLIVSYFVTVGSGGISGIVVRRPENLIAFWRRIFSFLEPSTQDRRELRYLCRLFRDSLCIPLSWLWTTFPHPKFSTLRKLVARVNEMAKEDSSNLPTVVFVTNGVHRVTGDEWRSIEMRTTGTACIEWGCSFCESCESFIENLTVACSSAQCRKTYCEDCVQKCGMCDHKYCDDCSTWKYTGDTAMCKDCFAEVGHCDY